MISPAVSGALNSASSGSIVESVARAMQASYTLSMDVAIR
jgi:hypothetical protein